MQGSGTVRLYTYRPKPAQVDALWTIESLLRKAVVDGSGTLIRLESFQIL